MIDVDGHALLAGLVGGLPASGLYFWGLAWGVRRALRAQRPAAVLLASFVLRAVLLLGLGVWLVRAVDPLWSLAGYILAFIIVRTVVVRGVRGGRRRDTVGQGGG